MGHVIPPPPQPSVAVHGSNDRFPVRRIFCVGRNYAAHAREMGKDPDREPPFFFTKAPDAVVDDGQTIPYPPLTTDLHHEAELVVAIGTGGAEISVASALDHVWGFGPGNDLTRRDLQRTAKEMARPWDWAKSFDRSAVVGPLRPIAETGPLEKGAITLTVNAETRQSADLADQIWSVPEVISYLSSSVTIAPGDLIMTGTPAGVGPLVSGDTCTVEIAGLGSVTTAIG